MNNNASILAKKERLIARINELSSEIDALHEQLVCQVCDGKDKVAIRPLMCKDPICTHCLELWYDAGITNPEKLRAESLKKQGRTEQQGKDGG